MIESLLFERFGIKLSRMIGKKNIFEANEFGEKYKNLFECGSHAQHHIPLHKITKFMKQNNITNMLSISKYYSVPSDKLFAVVRNPYFRYLSNYKWCAALKGCNLLQGHKFLHKHFNQTLMNYKNFNLCNITNFNKYTNLLFRYLIEYYKLSNWKKISYGACHNIPQYNYIYDEYDNKLVSIILKTESLTNNLTHLLSKYSNTKNISKNIIYKYYHKNKWKHNCNELTIFDINTENIKLIQMYYKNDFKYFNYSTELPQLQHIENKYNNSTQIVKTIWILWFQGWTNAPIIPRIVLQSWKYFNEKDWEIIQLSSDNLHLYVNTYDYYYNLMIEKQSFKWQGLSDIIRIELLNKYGGVWVDATVFCTQSLNEWIFDYINHNGFFAFSKGSDAVSSWFLTSLYFQKSYIIKTWNKNVRKYFEMHEKMDRYFWFHSIFNRLCKNDIIFKESFDKVKKLSAKGPHTIKHVYNKLPGIPMSEHVLLHIDQHKSPMYKLDKSIVWNNSIILQSNVGYLLKKYVNIFNHN
eukprot:130998_1